ncbi:hypothetical protein J437_LFUL000390 [Ladona fulva]|uniref:Eukaryotic translation initiation factor 3 subunit B n=1 Tax=Ladona fulva TaxID=123851 RepID=A0A8K0K481_LADFU|nr:hypothetical protein J437_LFUL000390 [Ladona fulva]
MHTLDGSTNQRKRNLHSFVSYNVLCQTFVHEVSKMVKKKDSDKNIVNVEDGKNDAVENGDKPPNFADPPGFVDTITDEELLGDLLENKPKELEGVDSLVVVDGVPQVGPDRLEKLQIVIRKFFSKSGFINDYFPEENGTTKRYIFLEFPTPALAAEAVRQYNNSKFDKNHMLMLNLFTDFQKYSEIPDEWEPPEPQPYKDQGNMHYYLLEPDAFDQYAIICGIGASVQIWMNSNPEPTLVEERPRWTETYVKWSPLGTYLATFHKKGVALWGGPKFEQIMRFTHSGVQFIDFSPCEKYLVTYSPMSEHTSDPKRLIIWDIRTGHEKRSFGTDQPSVWPIFRWSPDDKYFARISVDVLSVYETPSFGLLNKKSFKIPGIRDFSWSPTDNIIAYWVAEKMDVPAKVTLLDIPSRNEIRAKNLFNVADCKIHWQKSGDFLCVKVDRYVKVKKEKNEYKYSGVYCNFEIFHMREKQIPVDSVEIKEAIHAFAWEPVGSKFAIIHGDVPNTCVSFYGVKIGHPPALLKRFEKREANYLFWAPCGQFIVMAGIRANGGVLDFVDSADFVIMNSNEHFGISDVEWDPTGRYVVTGNSIWKSKVDNGFVLYSFQGKCIKRNNVEGFCQLLWRPRPPSLLSAKQQKEIKKSLKKYSVQFESKDRMRMTKASKELVEKRCRLMKEFEDYRQKRIEQYDAQKSRRLELRDHVDTDELVSDTVNVEEKSIEFLIKEEVTVVAMEE